MVEKKLLDINSPDAKALRNEIVHGTFVSEGTMVAFPLCFPGASAPIAADESHITALDFTAEGIIYGGTSGRQTHLFVGMFHGVTGVVFDMGLVEGANHCAAICCGGERFVACVNGPDGGRLIRQRLRAPPFDLIQEWGFHREPFDDLGEAVKGEKIVHAVTDALRRKVIASTEGHLISTDIESGKIEMLGEIIGWGRLAIGSKGNIFGLDKANALWRYNPGNGTLTKNAVALPDGAWQKHSIMWARDRVDRRLYIADDNGNLFSFTEEGGFSPCLGQTALAPVGPMAVTFDGRVFGFCGEEISNLFCYNPDAREVTCLGVAASIIERRRYGYMFGDAVAGRDGQIFFGEDDDLGHLWIYFPRIQRIGY